MYRNILKYRLITIKIALNILFLQQVASNFVIKFIKILIYN